MPNFQEMSDLESSKKPKNAKEKEQGKTVTTLTLLKEQKETDAKENNKDQNGKNAQETNKDKNLNKPETQVIPKKENAEVKEDEKREEKEKGKNQKERPKTHETGPAKESPKTHETGPVKEIKNEKDLEARLKAAGDNLVIVDFYATWCMPCKMAGPRVVSLAEEYKDVTFYKVNADDNEALTAKYDVTTLPTFLYFKQGKLVDTVIGSNMEKVEESLKKLRKGALDGKKEGASA